MPVLYIILTAVAIGLLVGVHEFGHFIVAKLIGVRVEVFSIGFWKKIVSWKWGETEYRLCIVPLGGYVKLAGEERPKDGHEAAPYEFFSKPPFQRIPVFAAGAIMNVVLGFAAFIIAFAIGVRFIVPVVGGAIPGMPAWEAGMKRGDRIVELDGQPDPDFEDISRAAALSARGDIVSLKVEREGKLLNFDVRPKYEPMHGVSLLGIEPELSTRIMGLMKVATGEDEVCPAEAAGLELRDVILSIDGRPVETAQDAVEILRRSAGKTLSVQYRRGRQVRSTQVTPIPYPSFLIGVSCVSTTVEGVAAGGRAEKLGLKDGDVIRSIDGAPVESVVAVQEILKEKAEQQHSIEVSRGGEALNFTVGLKDVWDAKEFLNDFTCESGTVLTWVKKGSPADIVGMKVGDRILSVEGRPVRSWLEFLRENGRHEDAVRKITWETGGEPRTAALTPELSLDGDEGVIGAVFQDPVTRVRRYGLVKSIVVGTDKALGNFRDLFLTIRGFFTERVSTRQMGGIIMIAAVSYKAAEIGIGKLFYLVAVISIGLGFLNLFPIPVLDGGHIVFTLIEAARGKPVNERIMAVAQYVGIALLLALVIYVTRNDIIRILNL